MSAINTSFQQLTGCPDQHNSVVKRIKWCNDYKKKKKKQNSLFAYDMIVLKNLRGYIDKSELIRIVWM